METKEPSNDDKRWMKPKTNPKVRVGKDFQACIPECVSELKEAGIAKKEEKLTLQLCLEKEPKDSEKWMASKVFHDHVRIGAKYQAVIQTFATCEASLSSHLKDESTQRKREHEEGEPDEDDEYRDAKRQKQIE